MSDCIDLIAFRRLMCRFAERLSDEQRRNIVYIRLFQVREKYKNTEALDILSKLETDGLFSPTKPEGLIEIARDANRPDLASEVEKFIKSQRKTASKQEKKSHKQLKGAPQAAAESDMDLHLKANFEVTLSQATVLIKQVDVLEQAITAGKGCRHRVEEAMTEARQTAERLAQTLQKAQRKLESDSGSDRSSADLSPTADENKDWEISTCKHRLPEQVQSLVVSPDPTKPTPKPRKPRKGLASLRVPVQETAQSTASYMGNTHLQASVSGSASVPKPQRWIKPNDKPQPAPSTPSEEWMNSQHTKPAVPPRTLSQRSPAPTQSSSSMPPATPPPVARLPHHAMFQHADGCTNLEPTESEELEDTTAGTGDSGYAEVEHWKGYMQHPPSGPPIPDSIEQSHSYMSLIRSQMEAPYNDLQHRDFFERNNES